MIGGTNVIISLNHPYFALIDNALYNKQSKELIAYFGYYTHNKNKPRLNIPEGIVSIGDYALYDMDSDPVYIYFPSTLTKIGNHALEDTNFLVVEGSNFENIKTIGDCAFKEASYSTGNSSNYDVKVHFHSIESIGEQAFMESRWEEICFEGSHITEIPDEAFYNFSLVYHNLVNRETEAKEMYAALRFPTVSVKKIGNNNSKENDSGLGMLFRYDSDFSPELTNIPAGLSPYANSLPNTVTHIEAKAYLEKREDFYLPASLQFIAEDAFPEGSTFIVEANSYALRWCKDNGVGHRVNGEKQNLDWLTGEVSSESASLPHETGTENEIDDYCWEKLNALSAEYGLDIDVLNTEAVIEFINEWGTSDDFLERFAVLVAVGEISLDE